MLGFSSGCSCSRKFQEKLFSLWSNCVLSGESAAFGRDSLLPSCSSCLVRMSVARSTLGRGDTHSACPVSSLFCNLVGVSDVKNTNMGADKNEVFLLLILTWIGGKSWQKELDGRVFG